MKTKYRGKIERIITNARIDQPYLSVEEKGIFPDRSAYTARNP
jgi:hypothetical protein